METYDVIIVGAGPAGLYLAGELAGSNLKILLLDRKKNAEDVQYNTAGSFIDPKKWDLPDYVLNPVNEIYFCSKNRAIIRRCDAYVLNRKKLLRFFEKRAKRNKRLKIEYGIVIEEVRDGARGIEYIAYINGKRRIKAGSCIFADCSGASAILGRRTGLAPSRPVIAVGAGYAVPLKKEAHTADLFIGSNLKGGYGWIFPQDAKTAIVGYCTLFEERFPDVEKYLRDMWKIQRVADRCELKPVEKEFAVLRTGKPLNRFADRNLVIIGDSALQANPVLGEGIRFVMDAAKIAAKWIERAVKDKDSGLLNNYSLEWKKRYGRKYKISFMLQQMIKDYTLDDNKLDFMVKRLDKISDEDFVKLLNGDLSYIFLLKIILKALFMRSPER